MLTQCYNPVTIAIKSKDIRPHDSESANILSTLFVFITRSLPRYMAYLPQSPTSRKSHLRSVGVCLYFFLNIRQSVTGVQPQ